MNSGGAHAHQASRPPPPPEVPNQSNDHSKPTFKERAHGAATATDGNIQKAVDNKHVATTEAFAQGVFAKLGLTPTDSFCCCAPGMCGLRFIVLILSIIQMAYGICVLVVSIFSTLWGVIVYTASLEVLSIVLLIINFVFQLLIGLFYFVTGIYGFRATNTFSEVVTTGEDIVRQTHVYYKLNLVGFLIVVIINFVIAIFESVASSHAASIVLYWIWYVLYVTLGAYILFTIWSYDHWISAAGNGDQSALSKALKLPNNNAEKPAPSATPVQNPAAV